MKAIQLYLPTLFRSGSFRSLNYEHIDDVRGLLNFYTANLMQLHDYLLRRVEQSVGFSSVRSIDRLLNRLYDALKQGTNDIELLHDVIIQCPDLNYCSYFRLPLLPWRSIRARLIYYQVSRGIHPIIKLYYQYEYLFCIVERSIHSTSYRWRHLF